MPRAARSGGAAEPGGALPSPGVRAAGGAGLRGAPCRSSGAVRARPQPRRGLGSPSDRAPLPGTARGAPLPGGGCSCRCPGGAPAALRAPRAAAAWSGTSLPAAGPLPLVAAGCPAVAACWVRGHEAFAGIHCSVLAQTAGACSEPAGCCGRAGETAWAVGYGTGKFSWRRLII